MTQEKQSVLASIGGTIGGPRFVEQDEVCSAFPVTVFWSGVPLNLNHIRLSQWFIKQKQFLDSLESQIKSLVKALETSSKQRLGEIFKIPESRRYTLSDVSGGDRARQRLCCSLGGSASFGRVGSVLGVIAGATPFLPIERRRALPT